MTPSPNVPDPARPLVCIHGYSDTGHAFDVWKARLGDSAPPITDITIGNYLSLTNEVTIKDIARGFDRALTAKGIPEGAEFDAIVHSTGMLVIRSWLVTYPQQRARLKHLVGLAPATNGSPLAHKGRSVLGSIFKGNRELGPDFLAVGDEILDALELGSRFTWDLAMADLFGETSFYGTDGNTPYVFIFCGNTSYSGLRKIVNEPGTDGTVRWAGCSLNSRVIRLDVTKPSGGEGRSVIGDWHQVSNTPLVFCDGLTHGTITSDPPDSLVRLVVGALRVNDDSELAAWREDAERAQVGAIPDEVWQQFVVRVHDERGDPVPDYSLTLHAKRTGGRKSGILEAFEVDVHTYRRDPSLRNFHVSLTDLFGGPGTSAPGNLRMLELELTASTGTRLVSYEGISDPGETVVNEPFEVRVNLTRFLETKDRDGDRFSMFYPFTTTFLDICIDRRPDPSVYTFA